MIESASFILRISEPRSGVSGGQSDCARSFTKNSRLFASVGSVPSSGRPSCERRASTCGNVDTIFEITGAMRRPSVSEMFEGSVKVR